MRSRKTKTHLEEIAKKYNLKIQQVEDIAEAPFRFFAEIASEGNRETMEFDSVRIMGFGLFSVKEGRKKYFTEYNESLEDDTEHTED